MVPAIHRIAAISGALAACTCLLLAGGAPAAQGWQWYRTDFHVHSVVSADGFPDLGIISSSAKTVGFNAIFLTDHNLGSNFTISGMTANHMFFEDTYRRWTTASTGSLTSSTNALASAPVASGSASLHLAATSSSAGESFVWTKRGPNFRSGTSDAILTFKVYPSRLDGGSGIYVSASIGGDPTVKSPANNPVGYTNADGVVSPGKSTVFVFYFGAPPPTSFYGSARVIAYNLESGYCDQPFGLGKWISCTIDVRTKLADLAAADQPLAYNALSDLKIAAVGEAGTADAYFDAYSIDATSSSADEFVERNAVIGSYDTPTFRIFPSVEMGIGEHANRFNFDISDPSEFTSYKNGIDGIVPTQQTGYPAQLNHPGVDGGVTDQQAIDTNAEGADLIEVRQQNMINDWDAILRKGVPVVGTWGADNHIGHWTLSSQTSYVAAPALTFDELMHSIFEGRAYMGQASLGAGFVVNLNGGSQDPYPARYPVYVSPDRRTIPVHVSVGGSLRSGDVIRWLSNGGSPSTTAVIGTGATSAAMYDALKDIALDGESGYVRAEARTSSGSLRGLTEPILFRDVPGLPADITYHVERVTTPSGHDYTRVATQGITSTTWDAAAATLSVGLTNPPGSLVELRGTSASPPGRVLVDGVAAPEATSLDAFAGAGATTWYYDVAAGALYVKVLQPAGAASIAVTFVDAQPPTTPTGLSATAVASTSVGLSWNAATDNVGVVGYTVYRDGNTVGTATSTTLTDTSVSPGVNYTYTVDAYDAAGNHSAQSAALTVATPPVGSQTFTLKPTADAYVNAVYPTTNYGGASAFYVDGAPVRKSYVRFDLGTVGANVTHATLQIWANSTQSLGYLVFGVDSDTWDEMAINWDNQPTAWAALAAGTSGAVSGGTWTSVDVTALAQAAAGKRLTFGLSTLSSTNLSLASRESTHAPKLVVTTG